MSAPISTAPCTRPTTVREIWRRSAEGWRRQGGGAEPHNVAGRTIRPRQYQLRRGQSRPVSTERWAGLVDAMARDMKIPRAEADRLAPASIPMGRIAEVEEVANLVVMLASPMMMMVNGTMIEIDGGQDKPLMDRFRDRPKG